tara:strand:+ start:351 stop:827 length:477 start_codon:yes stop_codon:yes gene_type:complete
MKQFLITLGIFLLPFVILAQQVIQIGRVENNIKLGPYANNRDLAFGVQNILEEIIQDKGHDLSPTSETVLNVELLYFDVKKTNVQLAVYSKNTDATEIIARAYLAIKGKNKKPVVAKGQAKSISTATLIIDKGGKFSQTDVSTALKKVCIELIEKLKL